MTAKKSNKVSQDNKDVFEKKNIFKNRLLTSFTVC